MTFSERVCELALMIPEGRVTTYGALAKAAGGGAMASRSIGNILSKYPNQGVVPWHRIVYAGGKVWLDDSCRSKRLELYELEGIFVTSKGRISNFDDVFWDCVQAP